MTCHPWCKDIRRDEKVQAEEDRRSGPLPTLEAVIAQPFAEDAKCSTVPQPLYRSPPPASGWLTEEERLAIYGAILILDQHGQTNIGRTLESLLARSSPPEVVLKDFPRDAVRNLDAKYLSGWDQCMALAKRALAAAGVTVSASSGLKHENKGDDMTKSEAQAADYRAEASQHPFADSPGKCETGETQSGIRTERVTLEFEIDRGASPRDEITIPRELKALDPQSRKYVAGWNDCLHNVKAMLAGKITVNQQTGTIKVRPEVSE